MTNSACPIGRGETKIGCRRESCLYNVAGNCEITSCLAVASLEDEGERREATSTLYRVSQEELHASSERIKLAILANSYFEYLFSKPILDCRTNELKTLKESEAQYYEWRGKKTPPFSRVLEVVSSISTSL